VTRELSQIVDTVGIPQPFAIQVVRNLTAVSEAGTLALFVSAHGVWSEDIITWGWAVIKASKVATDHITREFRRVCGRIATEIHIAANSIAYYEGTTNYRTVIVYSQIALDDAALSNASKGTGSVCAYEIAADRDAS
jgi:hypothetical protein